MISPSSSTPTLYSQTNKPKTPTAEMAAEKFEQLLLSKILKNSRKTTFEGVLQNQNDEFFSGLLDRERSILISNSVDLKIAESLKKGR